MHTQFSHSLFAVSALAILRPYVAIADPLLDVATDVKAVCTQPASQDSHWSISGDGRADAGIQLKLLKVAGIQGTLHFTKEEWSGIQRVLQTQQAADNANYRACARELTPKFLERISVSK
jgi:hypothetical protein